MAYSRLRSVSVSPARISALEASSPYRMLKTYTGAVTVMVSSWSW